MKQRQQLICFLCQRGRFSAAIPSVMQRQRWVRQKHSWSRVTHDLFDFFLHVWSVTVDCAFSAGAFFVLKRAFVKPQKSVFFKLPAFGAELAFGFVVSFTVDVNHVAYGFLFTLHAFVFWVRRLGLHLESAQKIGGCTALKG